MGVGITRALSVAVPREEKRIYRLEGRASRFNVSHQLALFG